MPGACEGETCWAVKVGGTSEGCGRRCQGRDGRDERKRGNGMGLASVVWGWEASFWARGLSFKESIHSLGSEWAILWNPMRSEDRLRRRLIISVWSL